MKVRESKISGFSSIELNITLESVDEARLMYHILNHKDLAHSLINDHNYYFSSGHEPVRGNLTNSRGKQLIEQTLRNKGLGI